MNYFLLKIDFFIFYKNMISYGSSSVIIKTNKNTVIKRYHNFSEILENNIPKREVEFLKRINKNNNIIKLIS